MFIFRIALLILISSCSSQKEVIHGYDGHMLAKALKLGHGKTPDQVTKLLGQPAIKGVCRKCAPNGLYRMVYLKKDMRRFYLDLSLNTDMHVDCFVLEFMPDSITKKYIFDRATGYYQAKDCNQKAGAIVELQQIIELESQAK